MRTPDAQDRAARTVLVAHPSADRYGSDRMVLESVTGLVEAGWRVVLTVPSDGPLVAMVRERGGEVAICPTPILSKSLLSPRGLLVLVRAVVGGLVAGSRLLRTERPAAVLVNTVTIPLWLLLAAVHRVPSLCHVHEAERSASRALRTLLALPLVLATAVAANSRFAIGVVASSLPGVARRAQLVDNGVVGPAGRTDPRPELDGPVRLVYVGRLSPRKGVDVAVDAVGLLRDRGVEVHLDVVGAVFPGYEWYQEELRAQVERLGLSDEVELHGFVEPVWPLLHAADVAVVPSRLDEPFGNTAVEAVLCARPVVVSASGGLVEAVEGYTCALTVPPGDATALADAVETVVRRWPQMSSAAVQDAVRAERRHDPRRYRARIAALVGALDPAGAEAGGPR